MYSRVCLILSQMDFVNLSEEEDGLQLADFFILKEARDGPEWLPKEEKNNLNIAPEKMNVDELVRMPRERRIQLFGNDIETVLAFNRSEVGAKEMLEIFNMLCVFRLDAVAIWLLTRSSFFVEHNGVSISDLAEIPKIAICHNRKNVAFEYYRTLEYAENPEMGCIISANVGLFEHFTEGQLHSLYHSNRWVMWWTLVGWIFTNNVERAIDTIALFTGEKNIRDHIDSLAEISELENDAMHNVVDYVYRFTEHGVENNVENNVEDDEINIVD